MPHLTRTDLAAINDALQAEIADLTAQIDDLETVAESRRVRLDALEEENGALRDEVRRLAAALTRSTGRPWRSPRWTPPETTPPPPTPPAGRRVA